MGLVTGAWEGLLQSVKRRASDTTTSHSLTNRTLSQRKINVSKHLYRFLRRLHSFDLTIYSSDEILLVATLLTAESPNFWCGESKESSRRPSHDRKRIIRVSFAQYVKLLFELWEKLYDEAVVSQEDKRTCRQNTQEWVPKPRTSIWFWHRRHRDQYNRRVYVSNSAQWMYAIWKLIQVLALLPHWDHLLASIQSGNPIPQELQPSLKAEKAEPEKRKFGRTKEKKANLSKFFQRKRYNVRVRSAASNQSISVSRRSSSRRTPRGQPTNYNFPKNTKQAQLRQNEQIECDCSLIERYTHLHFDTLDLLHSVKCRESQLRSESLLNAKLQQELVVLLLAATFWRIPMTRAKILKTLAPETGSTHVPELIVEWNQHRNSHNCILLRALENRCVDATIASQALGMEQKAYTLLACIQHFTKWKLVCPHLAESQLLSFDAIVHHICGITKELYREQLIRLQPVEMDDSEAQLGNADANAIDLPITQHQTQRYLSVLCRVLSDHPSMMYRVLINILKETNGFLPLHVRACLQFMADLIRSGSAFFRTLALPEHWREILLLFQLFQRLIESEHFEILREAQLFLLNHLLNLSDEVQIRLLQLLEANFPKLFFHWSHDVRCYYHHLLVCVVYPGNRGTLSLPSDQLVLQNCAIDNTARHPERPQEKRWKPFEKRLIQVVEYCDQKLKLIHNLKPHPAPDHVTAFDTKHTLYTLQQPGNTTDDPVPLPLPPILPGETSGSLVESIGCEKDIKDSAWLVRVPFPYVQCAVEEYRAILRVFSDSAGPTSPLQTFPRPRFHQHNLETDVRMR
uniref:AlNc14C283G10140 protein n=1 Tax=Albugo laibachii Nc14 TaxID=890382 RepID=F0WUZ3_9STRA|nr:AlNc14C283G10140 [Albugo laibachii Nc14]|eukprot:CCA25229.1 AlNc14C283G10140 [Albugo laibachii Nc14]